MVRIPSGKKCMVVGCESLAKANDLCAMHYRRSKRHDGFLGETRHKRGTCSVDGCERPHAAKGLCSFHYYRQQNTGSVDDPQKVERVCEVEGCGRPHVASGLCRMHYMRMNRHGDVVQTRASDWGAREKHPLYPTWNRLMRYDADVTCTRWHDLWAFVEDMGDSRPSPHHRLSRSDSSKPFDAGNVYWKEPQISSKTDDKKRSAAEYMRLWRLTNLDRATNTGLRQRYGITLNDYNRMFDEQQGLCAVCHQEETRVDHRTKKVSRLAVDHDHKTGTVRGLLCHHCNNALGCFDDDLQKMMAAVVYLASHSENPPAVIGAAITQLQAALPIAGTA